MILRPIKPKELIIANNIVFQSPTGDEADKIKQKLTFENPAFKQAMLYSRYDRVYVPRNLCYFKELPYSLEIPIGMDITPICPLDSLILTDLRVCPKVNTPKFVLELREDQKTASENYLNYNTNNIYPLKGVVQMPTGKGKSIMGLYVASELKCKTLIVVHKNDLVLGWQKDIKLAFDNQVKPGLIKAQSKDVGEFLTIATVQTLSRMSKDEAEKLYSEFGLVIQDELHHCPASSYSVVANFNCRYRLGLSATPERNDGLDALIFLHYGDFAYKYTDEGDETDILPVQIVPRYQDLFFDPIYRILVDDAGRLRYVLHDWYAQEDVKVPNGYIRLSEIPYNSRPKLMYNDVDYYVVMNKSTVDTVIADIMQEFCLGRSSVAFFTQRSHCEYYYDLLYEKIGDNVQVFYGGNAKTDEELLRRAENREARVTLTTYSKGTEGTNVKAWEVAFLVSSINNEKNTEQAVGRIRRTKEGKINPVLVYDYCYPRVYSLVSHYHTRTRRYKKLGFTIAGQKKKSMFQRGFN